MTEGVVDLPTMKSLIRYLTSGGDVVRAQLVGRLDPAGPLRCMEVVIDAAHLPPRQIYRRELPVRERDPASDSSAPPLSSPPLPRARRPLPTPPTLGRNMG